MAYVKKVIDICHLQRYDITIFLKYKKVLSYSIGKS